MPSPERRRQQTEQKAIGLETEAAESLAERLHLREQYLAQVRVLYQSGMLENFMPTVEHPLPEMGITGVDGKKYILPSYEDILNKLKDPEKRRIIEQKKEQGFTKLLLAPFALPLAEIIQRYKDTLLKTNQESGIKATNGSTLELDEDEPIYIWGNLSQADNPNTPSSDQLEYFVKNYGGKTKEDRGGKYKSELLQADPANAWQILLIEDLPDLPAEGQGKTISGRKQIEARKSSKEYLEFLQQDPAYQNEQGLTPEADLALWLAYLKEQQLAIDDYAGQGKINWLAGSYLSGGVPFFFWCRGYRQPYLYRNDPDNRISDCGFRPAVSV